MVHYMYMWCMMYLGGFSTWCGCTHGVCFSPPYTPAITNTLPGWTKPTQSGKVSMVGEVGHGWESLVKLSKFSGNRLVRVDSTCTSKLD